MLVNARVAVSGILEELPQEPNLPAGAADPAATASAASISTIGSRRRSMRFDALAPAQTIAGPAIVEIGDDDGAAAAPATAPPSPRRAGSTSRCSKIRAWSGLLRPVAGSKLFWQVALEKSIASLQNACNGDHLAVIPLIQTKQDHMPSPPPAAPDMQRMRDGDEYRAGSALP